MSCKPVAPGGFVDLHNHILPGVDDGMRNMSESLVLLGGMRDLGYRRIVATPHRDARRFPACDKAAIERAFAELTVADEIGAVELSLGGEHMFEPSLIDRIRNGEAITLNGSRYLLVEFEKSFIPTQLPQIFYQIRLAGVTPILAHPERWKFLVERPEIMRQLHEQGSAIFQIDLLSLVGKHGSRAKRWAKKLLKSGMGQLISSDIHRVDELERLRKALLIAAKLLGPVRFEQVAVTNALRVFQDEILIQ